MKVAPRSANASIKNAPAGISNKFTRTETAEPATLSRAGKPITRCAAQLPFRRNFRYFIDPPSIPRYKSTSVEFRSRPSCRRGGPQMFCTRCGLKVEAGSGFCKSCGQEIPASTLVAPSATNAQPAPSGFDASVPTLRAYAEFWPRAAAYLIDGVILGIPFGMVVLVLIFLLGGFGVMLRSNSADPRAAAAFAAPLFLSFLFGMIFFVGLQWLYFAGMESSERQATFGKSAMSLRVANLEGQRLSFGHATGRFFAKIISGMIPLGIGYIMAAFTEKRQALHDMIAGTLVLRK